MTMGVNIIIIDSHNFMPDAEAVRFEKSFLPGNSYSFQLDRIEIG